MEDPLGVKEALTVTREFLTPIGESLSDAWKAIIGDRISHWRLRNAMELQKKTNAEAIRLGLTMRPERIPERYAFAWFEEATKQDEPEVQVLFARLLVRAAAGEKGAGDRRLIAALKEMTPVDAAIFQRVYSDMPFPDTGVYSETRAIGSVRGFAGRTWAKDWMIALVDKFHPGDAAISIENLIRIGCLGIDFKTEGERNTPPLPTPEQVGRMGRPEWQKLIKGFAAVREHVTATAIGIALADAVRESTS